MRKKNRVRESAKNEKKRASMKNIQRKFTRMQMILVITLAVVLGLSGLWINIYFEHQKRDQNLRNIAEAIAQSPILTEEGSTNAEMLLEYLDSLEDTLVDIDVISVVGSNNVRLYHSNHDLIGTLYDGAMPDFEKNTEEYYAVNESGPSGTQRRAYAAIYDEEGNYVGFVMAIMLMKNIRQETLQTLFIFFLITILAILFERLISAELSGKIRESLLGYEPDVFSVMYQIRDTILESLDEGVIAIDTHGNIQFANRAALLMLGEHTYTSDAVVGRSLQDISNGTVLLHALSQGEKELNVQERGLADVDVLIDRIPLKEEGGTIGTIGILHNRAEYTKLMEDLSGTRYLVDSMRANNHDFTNKLHVILGLIQMGMYDKATSYIENITIVQRATISKIMNAVKEPSVAALLIGKSARASELNIKFILHEGCYYSSADMHLPAEALITVIGNLLDNALDAMNQGNDSYDTPKELLFGIYSRPGAVLITVDDTGTGISEENLPHIFENGFSTKGIGRGTGLYHVKSLIESLGGSITVESQAGAGSSFSVSFTEKR